MNITRGIDSLYPEYDWWDLEFECFKEDLATRGIVIGTDIRGKNRKGETILEPAISFSGFYSQGDGLAFDATIDWAKFLETHSSFAEQLPEWYLLLAANPNDVIASTKRNTRHNNQMGVSCEWNSASPFEVEHGFFAGMIEDELPMTLAELEEWVLGACEAEATKMYESLESTYEAECEYLREQEVESLIEENLDAVREALAMFPEEHDEVDLQDLRELGLAERRDLTPRGKELLCKREN